MKYLFELRKSLKAICLLTLVIFNTTTNSNAQTTLQAGDLIFVGYNAEFNIDPSNDQFAFILLKNITANTEIYFTDYGWTSSNGFQGNPSNGCPSGQGSLSDGIVKWTATSAMSVGAQVVINCRINISANVGTAVGFQEMYNIPGNYMSLATGGDQIFAYQGSFSSPTLIAGFGMSGAWESSLTTCQLTATASVVPSALGTAYCWNLLPEVDNAAYNPSFGTVGSPATLRALIMDSSHWITDDNANVTLPVPGTFSTPLYVNISSFNARKENGTAGLYWTTEKEADNAGFDIQESSDGKTYRTIGTVMSQAKDGNSNTTLSYHYADKLPFRGINFYRLAEKDKKGNIVYSDIRTLNFDSKSDFNCYPNPVKTQLTVEYNAAREEVMNIRVTDVMGKMVLTQELNLHEGFNKTVIDMSDLSEGIYNIIIVGNSGMVYESKVVRN